MLLVWRPGMLPNILLSPGESPSQRLIRPTVSNAKKPAPMHSQVTVWHLGESRSAWHLKHVMSVLLSPELSPQWDPSDAPHFKDSVAACVTYRHMWDSTWLMELIPSQSVDTESKIFVVFPLRFPFLSFCIKGVDSTHQWSQESREPVGKVFSSLSAVFRKLPGAIV